MNAPSMFAVTIEITLGFVMAAFLSKGFPRQARVQDLNLSLFSVTASCLSRSILRSANALLSTESSLFPILIPPPLVITHYCKYGSHILEVVRQAMGEEGDENLDGWFGCCRKDHNSLQAQAW